MACEEGVRNRNFYIANLFASEKKIGLPNIASLVILVEPIIKATISTNSLSEWRKGC